MIMKRKFSIPVIILLFVSLLFNSCEKDPEEDVKHEY